MPSLYDSDLSEVTWVNLSIPADHQALVTAMEVDLDLKYAGVCRHWVELLVSYAVETVVRTPANRVVSFFIFLLRLPSVFLLFNCFSSSLQSSSTSSSSSPSFLSQSSSLFLLLHRHHFYHSLLLSFSFFIAIIFITVFFSLSPSFLLQLPFFLFFLFFFVPQLYLWGSPV